jgi:pimeloyl-ACP methyl ester carboxylesterase
MRRFISLLVCVLAARAFADGPADNVVEKVRPVPPPGAVLSQEVRAELEAGAAQLGREIESLRKELERNPGMSLFLPDVVVFHKAVDWALRYNEVFNPTNEVPAARKLLKQGLERAGQLRAGRPAWLSATGLVVRGYVSKLDGSVQPFGLVVPAGYNPGEKKQWRLDLWFHGRNEKLSELNFLADRLKSPGEFAPTNAIVLHTYSRFCNGQKLAGEVDVFEALDAARRSFLIDMDRLVVRGFSLGGAACWQIAAHHPGLWAAAAPGAGFSETPEFLKVFQNEKIAPTWFEQKLWHQYNATDYALNFFNLPVVAYSGELDAQKQAADIMAKAMKAEGLELTHIIGPGTKHSYHPAAKQEINRCIDEFARRGRDPMPRQVKFTTWMLRYNNCAWVTVDGLERHWEQARVEAEIGDGDTVRVTTTNVAGLTLSMLPGRAPFGAQARVKVILDGAALEGPAVGANRSWYASFHRTGNGWAAGALPEEGLRKKRGLQGPIDDAFMDSFLVVRPTGKFANEKLAQWAAGELARFTNEWRRHFRGDARVKDDTAVTEADIAQHNLILWGDAAANTMLAKVLPRLPLQWNAKEVRLGGKAFAAADHVPLMVHPNPLNPSRYVVLNSGFTIREYDYLNNARQVPKLPDWAVVDLKTPPSSRWPGAVTEAGFFDERWK